MVEFIKVEYPEFITEYSMGKRDPYDSPLRLLRQVAYRNGMSHCKVSDAKMHSNRLKQPRKEFSISFMSTYSRFKRSNLFNADETGIYYIPKLQQSLAFKGEGNKCIGHTKHGGRMTALLTVAADGRKLPILFIIPGKPGGKIEKKEIPSLKKQYPSAVFTIQKNAWMDKGIENNISLTLRARSTFSEPFDDMSIQS